MIGARDMAFPKLNALSFWLLLFGGIAFYTSVFFEPPQAGWTMYPPLSDDAFTGGGGVDAWIFLIHLTGLSSIVGAINFIATIHNMRARGMSWGRMPLFIWSILVYSYLLVRRCRRSRRRDDAADRPPLRHRLLRPGVRRRPAALAAPVLVLRAPRGLHHDPAGLRDDLGDPAGVRPKPIFGYKAIAASTVAIAFLGMLVWAHHMFATPTPTVVLAFFMLSSFTIAVPPASRSSTG
jgi:cytochrome c oxidase subunit 1